MADETVSFYCGALIRGHVRSELNRMVFRLPDGVCGDWREDKGWLQSTFYVRFTGKRQKDVDEWVEALFDFVHRYRCER